MNKPVSIASYEGDSLMLKIALYDEQNNPFDMDANEINVAIMMIEPLSLKFPGTCNGNCVDIFIESGILNQIGSYPFSVRIFGKGIQFTVLTGILTIQHPFIEVKL